MESLFLGEQGVVLGSRPLGQVEAPEDVLLRIQAAGLCRTDLYVAAGELQATPGVILGHEAAGIVEAVGSSVNESRVPLGALVGIDPRVPCGQCAACRVPATRTPDACLSPRQLGVEVDGVFAEFTVVPAACLYPIEARVSPLRAAYLEPVAAAMGALSAGLSPTDNGVIAGEGRIAELTARVLEYAGLPRPRILPTDAFAAAIESGTLDFVIDASLSSDDALTVMAEALRKGGTLVMKSRATRRCSFIPAQWVAREITVAARSYGRFADAARAVADPALVLEDLFGSARSLSEFEEVFREARTGEGVKQFFRVAGAVQGH